MMNGEIKTAYVSYPDNLTLNSRFATEYLISIQISFVVIDAEQNTECQITCTMLSDVAW